MNTTVWYEQVDIGLINLINEAFNSRVPIRFRSEDDFVELSYPCILITHLWESFDRYRYDDRLVNIGLDENNNVVREKSAKPYTLNYQVELLTTSITDMNELTVIWNDTFIDFNNLDVEDVSGNKRNCFMKLKNKTSSSEGSSDENRIFKRIYTYEIKVEIDTGIKYITPSVQHMDINEK